MKKTILIAESDVVLLEILRNRCIFLGLDVETAMRGDDAIRAVELIKPDLLCIQGSMLCGNGRRVCDELSCDLRGGRTPLIVLSDKTAEKHGCEFGDVTAYVIPRSGNLWHRMEPLLHELIDLAEWDRPARDRRTLSRPLATDDARGAAAAALGRQRALRIDAPRRSDSQESKETPVLPAVAAPPKDARIEVPMPRLRSSEGVGRAVSTTAAPPA